MPTAVESDHSSVSNGSGPSWVASIVNAVGQSQYWNSTAIFVTWDDWGGWYDHVAPQIFNQYELGFRVPLIVISPYAKKAYVSHVQHEFGSILHYTEEQFGLNSIGYTDARADDLSDCFDYTQTPTPFKAIPAKYPASYFLHLPPSNEPVDY
jgi:phospholipase C